MVKLAALEPQKLFSLLPEKGRGGISENSKFCDHTQLLQLLSTADELITALLCISKLVPTKITPGTATRFPSLAWPSGPRFGGSTLLKSIQHSIVATIKDTASAGCAKPDCQPKMKV